MESIDKKHTKKGTRGNKMKFIILGILLAIILAIAIFIMTTANKNVTAMNNCIDAVLNELSQSYTMTPRDTGEYKNLSIYGIMKFHAEQYDIEELGNLSVMRMNMGIMQMATVVITPRDKTCHYFPQTICTS